MRSQDCFRVALGSPSRATMLCASIHPNHLGNFVRCNEIVSYFCRHHHSLLSPIIWQSSPPNLINLLNHLERYWRDSYIDVGQWAPGSGQWWSHAPKSRWCVTWREMCEWWRIHVLAWWSWVWLWEMSLSNYACNSHVTVVEGINVFGGR